MVVLNTRELAIIASKLLEQVKRDEDSSRHAIDVAKEQAQHLLDATTQISRSHSGSNFGWHGGLYYRDFQKPPLGSIFSVEWGGINGIPSGWHNREPEEVKNRLEELAGITFSTAEDSVKTPLESAKRLQREILA